MTPKEIKEALIEFIESKEYIVKSKTTKTEYHESIMVPGYTYPASSETTLEIEIDLSTYFNAEEQKEMMKNDELVITDFEMIGLQNTKEGLKRFSELFNLGKLEVETFGEENQHMIIQCENMINPITRINLRQKGYPIYWGNDFLDNNTIFIK